MTEEQIEALLDTVGWDVVGLLTAYECWSGSNEPRHSVIVENLVHYV